jgi:hypothetical protein
MYSSFLQEQAHFLQMEVSVKKPLGLQEDVFLEALVSSSCLSESV